jgi:hypothetical protein
LPLNLFKDAATKAPEEFARAYDKGVNLGPEKWQDAADSFSEAAKHFAEAGNPQKSSEALALATLFNALVHRDAESWRICHEAMTRIGDTQINVGFAARSAAIAQQVLVMHEDVVATSALNSNSHDASRVGALKNLAQKYLELTGEDLVVWKLMKAEVDPQRRAYYLLGLAALVEANSLMDSDPRKAVSLLSESATDFEMAGVDPMNLRAITMVKRDNASRVAKCWFCGREVQGMGTHYVMLQAVVSNYTKQKYGSEVPQSVDGAHVVACESCSSSIRMVADAIGRMYYERAITEMNGIAQRLEARITSLENAVNSLRIRTAHR